MAPETIADLATARTVIADLQAALARAEGENTWLRQQLDVLCHKLFGKKSEGVSDAQLRLAFAQLNATRSHDVTVDIACLRETGLWGSDTQTTNQ
jgi:hypothetical protein